MNAALVAAGLRGLDGVDGEGDGFEEKFIPDSTSFTQVVDELESNCT